MGAVDDVAGSAPHANRPPNNAHKTRTCNDGVNLAELADIGISSILRFILTDLRHCSVP